MAEEEPQAAAPKVVTQDQLLVSDGLNTSFAGMVTAHNGLVQSHGESRQSLATVEQDLAKAKQGIQEAATKQDERNTSFETRLEEMQKQNQELQESLKALLEERLKASEERADAAFKELEESTGTKVSTLEMSLQSATAQIQTSSQAQLKMRAEIDTEMNKLAKRLEELRAAAAADLARSAAELLAEQAGQLGEVTKALATKAEVEDLLAKLAEAVAQTASVSLFAEEVEAKRAALAQGTTNWLEGQWKRVEKLVLDSTTSVHEEVKQTFGKSLEALELVVKQMDFERLGFEGRASQDLEALRESGKAYEQVSKTQAGKLVEEFQVSLDKGIDGVRSSFDGRLSKTEGSLAALSAELSQLDAGVTKARQDVEDAKKAQTETAKIEAGKVLSTLTNELGGRISELAISVKTASMKIHGLAEQLDRDLAATRQMVSTSYEEAGRKFETVEAAEGRAQPLKQAVNALVQEFEEVTREQKKTHDSVGQMSTQLSEFEARVMGGGFYFGPVYAPPTEKPAASRLARPSSAHGRRSWGKVAGTGDSSSPITPRLSNSSNPQAPTPMPPTTTPRPTTWSQYPQVPAVSVLGHSAAEAAQRFPPLR